MKTKHYTIPIFIPELACPFRCIYCDQHKITGQSDMPSPDEVGDVVDRYLASFPGRKKEVEIGFFGGNFTGIDMQLQEEYLKVANAYLSEGRVQGIRLSTRPDYINGEVMKLLKKYKVRTVELGAQSMVDEVLHESHRGHSASDTVRASHMIRDAHMRLGLQMMIGLPGDSLENDIETARAFVELAADDVRIYPTLVIRGTALEKLFREGKFSVMGMEEAVLRTAEVYRIFEEAGINVIRIGLHPSEGLLTGDELVAGPFHEAFRELVMTEIWAGQLMPLADGAESDRLEIHTSPAQFNFAIGYAAKNKKALLEHFKTVVFIRDESLTGRQYHAYYR
ncbi:MAG TPA: radical SAM protein [Bacteroidales bacterium]|nr:radical SAM protein [Bacteroidales bacterium]